MTYEKLAIEYNQLKIKEKDFSDIDPEGNLDGLCVGNKIFIRKELSDREKVGVLAEELGHYYTTTGNILDQSTVENRQQERRARIWGYERLIGIIDLVDAYKDGVRNRYELSEYLGVNEEFIEDALNYYKEKYGLYYNIDNYIVYFEPLVVLQKF